MVSGIFLAVLDVLACEFLMRYAYINEPIAVCAMATIFFVVIHCVTVSGEYLDEHSIVAGYFFINMACALLYVNKGKFSAMDGIIIIVHLEVGYLIVSVGYYSLCPPITAQFLLMKNDGIETLSLLGSAIWYGCNTGYSSTVRKSASMILAVTSGSTVVGILTNTIPVALTKDTYVICILISITLIKYQPTFPSFVESNPFWKGFLIISSGIHSAHEICSCVTVAASKFEGDIFPILLFPPILFGTIGGCGGAFLPLYNQGLDSLENGLPPKIFSAFVGATFFHLFTKTTDTIAGVFELPDDLAFIAYPATGQFIVVAWKIFNSVYQNLDNQKKKEN